MLNQPTMDKLHALRPGGMAEAFRRQLEDPASGEPSFEQRFGMLVDSQWLWKENRALARRLAGAKLKIRAAVEDIDSRHPRGLDRARFLGLAHESGWARRKQNVVLPCPTGIGKSYLACALACKACRDGFSALYARAPQLFRDLAAAHADGSYPRLLARLARVDALVVDDWLMAPPSEPQRRDFLEICVERHLLRSTILTSQTPLDRWHAQVGDPVAADSILDRLLHNAHQFELQGESLRKERGRRSLDGTGDES